MDNVMPRDRKLLELLQRYQVLSTRQVRELVFRDIAVTNMFRRLRRLEKSRLIRRSVGLSDQSMAWCLSADGAKVLGLDAPGVTFNRNTLDHDVTLSQVRLSLERVGLGDHWASEMSLRRAAGSRGQRPSGEKKVIPDGIMPVKNSEGIKTIAVELELHTKNRRRYREICRKYNQWNQLWLIWYIVPTAALGELVCEEWNRVEHFGSSPQLVWSLLDQVLKDPWNMRIRNQKGSRLLRELIQMKAPVVMSTPLEISKNQVDSGDHTPDHSVIGGPHEKATAA